MDRFEYRSITWEPSGALSALLTMLNQMGAEGWEVLGLAPRAVSVPAPGMGAQAVPEMIVLLKRRLTPT
jgi:hypothetical protein